MSEQDKQFLACLFVWLDWSIYQSVRSINHDFPDDRPFEKIRFVASKLVKEFTKPVETE